VVGEEFFRLSQQFIALAELHSAGGAGLDAGRALALLLPFVAHVAFVKRLENENLKLVGIKMVRPGKSEFESFYEIHRGKPF
jgi:hypothetical protein